MVVSLRLGNHYQIIFSIDIIFQIFYIDIIEQSSTCLKSKGNFCLTSSWCTYVYFPSYSKHHTTVFLSLEIRYLIICAQCLHSPTEFPCDLYDEMTVNLNMIDAFMIYWILGNSKLLSRCKVIRALCLNSILVTDL